MRDTPVMTGPALAWATCGLARTRRAHSATASALPWNGGQVDTLDSPHRSLVICTIPYRLTTR
jgi:hypothetical protein